MITTVSIFNLTMKIIYWFILDHSQRAREFFKYHILPLEIDKIEWPKVKHFREIVS